jgi:hypothetical protein
VCVVASAAVEDSSLKAVFEAHSRYVNFRKVPSLARSPRRSSFFLGRRKASRQVRIDELRRGLVTPTEAIGKEFKGQEDARSGLRSLDLNNYPLAGFPESLPSTVPLDRINALYLVSTGLTAFPDTVAQLPSLEVLVLAQNKLAGSSRRMRSAYCSTLD